MSDPNTVSNSNIQGEATPGCFACLCTIERFEDAFVCGACKKTFYCSQECQSRDWNVHKSLCQQLRHEVGNVGALKEADSPLLLWQQKYKNYWKFVSLLLNLNDPPPWILLYESDQGTPSVKPYTESNDINQMLIHFTDAQFAEQAQAIHAETRLKGKVTSLLFVTRLPDRFATWHTIASASSMSS